jgi:hypothetical protein
MLLEAGIAARVFATLVQFCLPSHNPHQPHTALLNDDISELES